MAVWVVFSAFADAAPSAEPIPEVAPAPGTVDEWVERAHQQARAGDLPGALASASSAIDTWPTEPEPYVLASSLLLATGDVVRLGALYEMADQRGIADDRLAAQRIIAALLSRHLEGVPTDAPLRQFDLDGALAVYGTRGEPERLFADTMRLVEALAAWAAPDGEADARGLRARADALLQRPGAPVAVLEAGAAALTQTEDWARAVNRVSTALDTGADPDGCRVLLGRLEWLWGVQSGRSRHLAKAVGWLGAVEGPGPRGPAALEAERFAVGLAARPLPEPAEVAELLATSERLVGALDPAVPEQAAWRDALAITEATLALAGGDRGAAAAFLARVDLAAADPVAGLVASLVDRTSTASLRPLADGDDARVSELAQQWLDAPPDGVPVRWTPVATGAANVGLSVGPDGPTLAVSMAPTVVQVLVAPR